MRLLVNIDIFKKVNFIIKFPERYQKKLSIGYNLLMAKQEQLLFFIQIAFITKELCIKEVAKFGANYQKLVEENSNIEDININNNSIYIDPTFSFTNKKDIPLINQLQKRLIDNAENGLIINEMNKLLKNFAPIFAAFFG